MEERLFVRIDKELKTKAIAKAKAEGLKLSDVIRKLLSQWLEEQEEKPPPK